LGATRGLSTTRGGYSFRRRALFWGLRFAFLNAALAVLAVCRALGFAGYRAVLVDLTKVVGVGVRLWAPPVAGHEAGLEDVQSVEELGELIGVA
jgi:hypothetical protein